MIIILDSSEALRKGDRGENVTHLQNALNAVGQDAGTADGIFGDGTRRAVEAFQSSAALKADGIAGKDTFGALSDALQSLDSGGGGIDTTAVEGLLATAEADIQMWLGQGAQAGVDPSFLAEGEMVVANALGAIRDAIGAAS